MNNRIKQIREESGLTQESFGERIGSARNTIANYENGNRKPSNAIIISICREFNINETWLRDGTGEMREPEEDEVAAYVSDLIEEDNPFYDMIKGIMKTYSLLGEKEKSVIKSFAKDLQKNLTGKD